MVRVGICLTLQAPQAISPDCAAPHTALACILPPSLQAAKDKYTIQGAAMPDSGTPNFRRAFRGYSPEDVDEFLRDSAKEFDQLRTDLKILRAERDGLNAELAALKEERAILHDKVAALEAALESAHTEAHKTQMELNELRRSATSTDDILRAAHDAATKMIEEAEQKSKQLVLDAERRVETIYTEMRERQQELNERYERTKREFHDFLESARQLSLSFQRKLSETRDPFLG